MEQQSTLPSQSKFMLVVTAIFGFIWRCLRGVTDFVKARFTRSKRYKKEQVTCYIVHTSFFLWALILIGWIITPILNNFPNAVHFWTWVYVWAVAYTFVMLIFNNLSTKVLVLTSIVVGLIVMTIKYFEVSKNIFILSYLFSFFSGSGPVINGGFPKILSCMLFIPWVVMLVEAYRSGRKSFSPNGIEERSILVNTELTDRVGLHFVCRYPNLLKTLLGFGSGSIIAYNSRNVVMKRWDDIFALWFRWPEIDEILHQRSALVDNSPGDVVEVHEGQDALGDGVR